MILDEIQALLTADEAIMTGFVLFKGSIPGTAPDGVIGLYEYPGEMPSRVKRRKEAVYERPRFQVLVRSKSYDLARRKAEAIHRLLDGYSGVLSGASYASITALQSPFFLQRDESGRAQIACNYKAMKALSPLA